MVLRLALLLLAVAAVALAVLLSSGDGVSPAPLEARADRGSRPDAEAIAPELVEPEESGPARIAIQEAAVSRMSADWRRDAAFVAELARAYGQVRDQVGAELLAWHEGRAIGTQEFNRVCASREWRRLEPEPDLACFAEFPEAELAQVAYLVEETLLYDAQIGERPFAPYRDDGAQKLRHLLEKVPAFSLPVPALLQLELGKERLEWPAELLAAIGELRDRTWREASRHLATVYAAENAGAKAAAQVGLSLEDFRFQDDLGLIAPDWRDARASLDALSAWYRGELERLARESVRD